MDVYLAMEAALDVPSRRTIIERARAINPNLRGARVADILDIYDMHDAFMDFRESPYWESADGKLFRVDDTIPISDYFRVACIAVRFLSDDDDEIEPTNFTAQFVALLARRAYELDKRESEAVA